MTCKDEFSSRIPLNITTMYLNVCNSQSRWFKRQRLKTGNYLQDARNPLSILVKRYITHKVTVKADCGSLIRISFLSYVPAIVCELTTQ